MARRQYWLSWVGCAFFALVVAAVGCAPTSQVPGGRDTGIAVEDLVEDLDVQRTVRLGTPNESIALPPRSYVEAPVSDDCELGGRRLLDGLLPEGVTYSDFVTACYWIGGEATEIVPFVSGQFGATSYVSVDEFGNPDDGSFWQLWTRPNTNCLVFVRYIYSVDRIVLLQVVSQISGCSTFS